jgi:uncharacterized protein YbjQ (UPF0145 family)
MIVTTTSTIPNEEIKSIISVVHNRVVLGTNLFSDISATFSDIFGGNNSAYEKRLAEITDDVIDGLTKKALKLRADALIDLKIDVDEINGKSKSMFMVTAIAVLLKNGNSKKIGTMTSEVIRFEDINTAILKNRIIKLVEKDEFKPNIDWVSNFIINNRVIEVFESYIAYVKIKSDVVFQNWEEHFYEYLSHLENDELFEHTLKYFSKDDRSKIDSQVLKIILERLDVNYERVLNILNKDGNLEEKRLCLNMLYHTNDNYKKVDFDNIKQILDKIKVIFPNLSSLEIGSGMFTKGSKYWKCQCGSKNDVLENQFCTKCHLDQFGNKNYVRNVYEVIEKLEEIINAVK